jgi:hypothetical protein
MAAGEGSPLRALRERATGPPKTVTAFGPEPYDDLRPVLDRFDADLRHESLPVPEESGYLVVRRGEEYLGAVPAAAFDELRDPSAGAPWDATGEAAAYRELVGLLSGTAFEMDEKARLVATAREVEDRAWRTGRGTLYVTFQSLSAFRTQAPMYEQLGGTTDLAASAP